MNESEFPHLLGEQIEYYRARANEYDDWFFRVGRYDRGEAQTRRWFDQVEEVRRVLKDLPLDGKDILELAPGTGLWTEELCERAARLTVVDASPEMLALNHRRLGGRANSVTYVEADLFEWQSNEEFDVVVFCFWISHIPSALLDPFLSKISQWLRPGGLVFFLDARKESTSTASDHVLPGDDEEVMVRRLDDGREFSIVKNFWSGKVLEEKCRNAGLDVGVYETSDYFQFGYGIKG